ncbi:Scd6-like Sm domain containing protein [Nitzschia inconspicua]|uniref:Scd6-like Sm domain containing protein n=1 Tax=Nitzschia inconspicua TaxID=303405 RepID=A0A9K3KCA3_9STRA|nr:Scd6-like Sm domain containing protein [Nitzschia inconspicua]
MAQNPLLGSKISLISKKNIRYEGTLYSINEANATVALQNVTSFGTEGREKLDPETAFVAPQEGIHAYLLFRGCDIKDLHVHEPAKPPEPAPAAATASQPNEPATAKAPPKAPPASDLPPPPQQSPATNTPTTTAPTATAGAAATGADKSKGKGKENQPSRSGGGGGPKKTNNRGGRGGAQVGTGASLLNRKARGTVQSGPGPEGIEGEFDFQAKLEEFEKDPDDDNEDDDEAGDEVAGDSNNNNYYDKDDFFDSISCDALDKQQGIDNRLRGKEERNLNTETFGAVALDSQRRRRGRGGGRGGGGGGGRSTGGRGRGRGGRGRGRGRGRYNNSENGGTNRSATKGPVQPTASS